MATRTERPLAATIDIDAPPAAVWRVVSDVRRTGEWSPECHRVVPLGEVRAGTWLFGLNHRERVRWPTVSRVVTFEREREISWSVKTNRSVWTYRLEPSATGTQLVQDRDTSNGIGRFARWFTEAFLGGQAGHDDELEAGMAIGLRRIKELAEAG